MKTKEELNALKEEVETLSKKLAELTEEELAQVAGKEEQGSGRMTFFCSIGIKERRSKADFAPTWKK